MSGRVQHGSLQKRKRGGVWKWLGSYWENGSHKTKTLGTCAKMTKTEAQAELDKLVQPINEARGATEITLQGYARQVVFPWYRRKWKHSTAITTTDRIDHHILKELGDKPLSSFTRDTLQEFLDKKAATRRQPRRKKGEEHKESKTPQPFLSHSTIAHLRWDLRQLFRMAVNDGIISRNPSELLHVPTSTRTERHVLTIDDVRTILAALPLRDKLILELAAISGMRPGEIFALKWSNLRDDGIHIEQAIYRAVIQTPKTRTSIRTAAISTTIRNDLAAWRAIAPNTKPHDWIFPNERGTKPLTHGNYWQRYIKPTLKDLMIEGVTFQALRRTAVTLMNSNAGADSSIVAAQCGHSVDVSLNVYNKVGIQRQQETIDQLDQTLAAQSGPTSREPLAQTESPRSEGSSTTTRPSRDDRTHGTVPSRRRTDRGSQAPPP